MKIILLLSASIIGITTCAASAVADKLKGSYGYTFTSSCVLSTLPFDANFNATGPAFGESLVQEGVRTFNGDGTGTVSANTLTVTIPALTPAAGSSSFTTSFTYTTGDDTWAIPGGGTLTGSVESGPRTGQTFKITNLAPATGRISKNRAVLTYDVVKPTVEVITYYTGTVPVATYNRICNRSAVLMKLDDDGVN
jgi:hypothetical protein